MKYFTFPIVLLCATVSLLAQRPTIGSELQGGIVCIVDTAKHKAIIFRQPRNSDYLPWNDADNLIDDIEDSTDVEWRMPTITELEKIFMNRESLKMLPEKCYWSSSVDPIMKNRQSDMSFERSSMDGSVHDPMSSGEQYIETLNFFSRVRQPFKKSDSQHVLLVRTVEW